MLIPFIDASALTAAMAGSGKAWGGDCNSTGSTCSDWYNPIYNKSNKVRLYCLDADLRIPSSSGVSYTRLSQYDIKGVGPACAFIATGVPTNYWNYDTFVKSSNTSTIVKNDYKIKSYIQKYYNNTTKCSSYTKVSGSCDAKNQAAVDDGSTINGTIGNFALEGNYYVAELKVTRTKTAATVKYKVMVGGYNSDGTRNNTEGGAIVTASRSASDVNNLHGSLVNASTLYIKVPKNIFNSLAKVSAYLSVEYSTKCTYKAPMLQTFYPTAYVTNGKLNTTGLKYFNETTGRRKAAATSSIYQSLSYFTTYEDSVTKKFSKNKMVNKSVSAILGNLSIEKVDSVTRDALKGVTFALYSDSTCKTVVSGHSNLVTDDAGTISVLLNPGTYYVKELSTVAGYKRYYNDCRSVTITAGNDTSLVISNEKLGSITIEKYAYGTNEPVANAEFKLYKDSSCSTEVVNDNHGDPIGTIKTGTDGKVTINNLMKYDYYIKESVAPSGYVLNNTCFPAKVLVGEDTEVRVSNYKKYSLTINKTDAASGLALAGVKFKLCLDNKCNVVAKDINGNDISSSSLITDSTGKIVVNNLKYGTYYYKEIEVPAGYHLDDTVRSISVNDDKVLNIANSKVAIKLKKVSVLKENENLPGAVIVFEYLTKAKESNDINNIEISTFTTTDKVSNISVLPGVYLVYESISPSGYVYLSDAVLIEIDEDGNISKYNKDDYSEYVSLEVNNDSEFFEINEDELKILNDPANIRISKLDIASSEEVKGATIIIYDENDKEVVKYVSDGKVSEKYYLEPGKYVLVEKVPPKGYKKLENKIEFTLNEYGEVILEDADNEMYITDGLGTIIIYNEVEWFDVPITGLAKDVILIVLGTLLIGGGVYIIYRRRKAY